MATKLQDIRTHLAEKGKDLQRNYNWRFTSTKLKIFKSDLYIQSVEHPFLNYDNQGDYRGYISGATKPSEISMTILEDNEQTIGKLFDMWDSLKYNKATGIAYPKAVAEDQGFLIYTGGEAVASAGPGLVDPNQTKMKERRYLVQGLYPINRSSISLSYDGNDVIKISVTFNVDDITPVSYAGVF